MNEHDHLILGVVPVFINTTAAVLPAIVGPIVAAAANIFRPRAMLQIIRRNPVVFLTLFLFIGLSLFAGWVVFSKPVDKTRLAKSQTPVRFDWAQWARDQIENPTVETPNLSTRPTTAIHNPATQPVYFRNGARRTGSDGVDVGLPMRQVWIARPEQGAVYFSSPTVFDGRVYIGSYVPGLAEVFGTLFCLDAETGGLIWKRQTYQNTELKPFFSSPAISSDGKSVVIGEGFHEDADSRLICFDALTGAEK